MMKFRLWLGRNSENNKALSFCGKDGLNQRSRGYWHKTFWFGPLFFSVVSDNSKEKKGNAAKMRGILVVFVMALCEIAVAQSPVAKPTPAAETLVAKAKEMKESKANFDKVLQQSRSANDASQKQLQEQIQAKSKEFQEKLKSDKKYGPMLAEIETLQKQLSEVTQQAQARFNEQTMPIQQTIATDNALIAGLIPIVRKESEFDDTVTFDVDTQTWKKAEPKVEPKKE